MQKSFRSEYRFLVVFRTRGANHIGPEPCVWLVYTACTYVLYTLEDAYRGQWCERFVTMAIGQYTQYYIGANGQVGYGPLTSHIYIVSLIVWSIAGTETSNGRRGVTNHHHWDAISVHCFGHSPPFPSPKLFDVSFMGPQFI